LTTVARHSRKVVETPRTKLTKPQWEIYSAGWKPDSQFRVACCGRRFGKSFCAIEELRRAARLAVKLKVSPDNEIWYAAPTFTNAKRIFWRRLKRGIPQSWLDSKPNETSCTLTLKSGHIIRLVGLDNYDNLRGSGLWFVVVDEAADAAEAAWDETLEPMLATADGHALFIGTPKGLNWFYRYHCKGRPGGSPGFRSFSYTTIQGGNVSAAKIAKARAEKDPRTFRQEYEASFETFEGRVVYAFTRANHVRPCPLDPALPIWVGMDFNVNPMSAVVGQTHGDVDWVVGEVVIPTSNTDVMCAELKRRFARNGSVAHITVYPDPAGNQRRTSAAGKTDISILQGAGFRVDALTSHPAVRDRINITNARFETVDGTRRTFVDPACKEFIAALEQHVYKAGTSEPMKNSGFDHLIDGFGYAAFTKYSPRTVAQAINVNFMGR
jgi:hypothetical protein